MYKDGNKNWFRLAWHPPDEELLAFLDGELNAKHAGKVQKHLEGCWGCRAKREKFERSISVFVNNRNAVLDEAGESQARAHKRFADKLNTLVAERTELPSDFFRIETPVRQSSYFMRAALSAVVLFLVIGAGIWFGGERYGVSRRIAETRGTSRDQQIESSKQSGCASETSSASPFDWHIL